MKIEVVEARWLRVPLTGDQQHISDFGRQSTFDMAIVRLETDSGLVGWGEAKSSVGSSASCASVVACINHEFAPVLRGRDPREITRLWETMYSGSRAELALRRGRAMPALNRRGVHVAAISGIDIALWDLLGKSLNVPVVQLLGGACRDTMPAYASGGWADAAGIGAELRRYVDAGFHAVKMRVGAMDGSVNASAERVRAARAALGSGVALMCDAHGTMSASEGKRFCRAIEECSLYWLEEPCSNDDPAATAEVRASASVPIALGESLFTRFEVRDAIERRCMDVVQPDAAIIGGITETARVARLCETHQLELAPHLWGSAISFMAGLHVAFSSTAARILEYSLGGNPMLRELVDSPPTPTDGAFPAPTAPGLGVSPRPAFIDEFSVQP